MLYVERSEVGLPKKVQRSLRDGILDGVEFYKRRDRSQERFVFETKPWIITKPYLQTLFSNTCAFCECEENLSPLEVEHFRPTSEACNLDGASDPDAYWWLACEWENLYLICQTCNFQKRNFFPIAGKRGRTPAKNSILRLERPLLLDPCFDRPERHLRFLSDGTVTSLSNNLVVNPNSTAELYDRGAVTISVLALNRVELVTERSRVYEEALKKIAELEPVPESFSEKDLDALEEEPESSNGFGKTIGLIAYLEELIDEFGSFVALKRQLVARYLVSNDRVYENITAVDQKTLKSLEKVIKEELAIERLLDPKHLKKSRKRVSQDDVEIRYDNLYIRKLAIHNFRILQNFEISMSELVEVPDNYLRFSIDEKLSSEAKRAVEKEYRSSWKMLIGENSTGKSSVLKAISIALMGEAEYRRKSTLFRLEAQNIFNNRTDDSEGYILVELSRGDPIEIRFDNEKLRFVSGKEGAKGCFVRGYGSARLFSRKPQRTDRRNPDVEPLKDIANLFHPEILLANPEQWLEHLTTQKFNSTGLTLRDLLDLPAGIKKPLSKPRGVVHLDSGNGPLPLTAHSDGYNSILALVVDILAGLPESLHDKSKAAGIVLIDELESHLHPSWKMRIVSDLRKTFPNIQFIATTHDPLCLRGLGDDEVAVLKRDGQSVQVISDGPSMAGMPVDELLTSELFGLESTIDPQVEQQFNKYYELLSRSSSKDDGMSAKNRKKLLEELKEELSQYNKLGDSARDRLVYDMVDEYIARGREAESQADKTGLLANTKKKVFELWDSVQKIG